MVVRKLWRKMVRRVSWRVVASYFFLVFIFFIAARLYAVSPENVPGAVLFSLPFAVALAWVYYRKFQQPLEQINAITRQMAQGKLNKEIRILSNDEIAELAQNINTLAGRLRETISEITDEKNRMQAILNSMSDGVIAVCRGGRIITVNHVVEQILHQRQEDLVGKDLVGVLRHYDFDRLLKIALQSQEEISEEIQLLVPEARIYRVTFTPLLGSDLGGDRGGVVVVLRDVTERRQVEQMRSEFIANVSHELRTPLTSISGFLETLLDGALEDRELARHFLQIISDETRRITRLLDDLFALSNIEYRRVTPRRDNVYLADVAGRVREIFLPQAQEKNIRLVNNMQHDLPPVVGDSDMLTRVLINLVDNAIKYTPEGGTVSIKSGLRQTGEVYISVSDTGIGIPADSLPRVFERLYRVDRARVKGNGSGYGLGLAIVKHIVELHRGRIEVQSTPGVGSTFTVFLPLPEEQKQLQ